MLSERVHLQTKLTLERLPDQSQHSVLCFAEHSFGVRAKFQDIKIDNGKRLHKTFVVGEELFVDSKAW